MPRGLNSHWGASSCPGVLSGFSPSSSTDRASSNEQPECGRFLERRPGPGTARRDSVYTCAATPPAAPCQRVTSGLLWGPRGILESPYGAMDLELKTLRAWFAPRAG